VALGVQIAPRNRASSFDLQENPQAQFETEQNLPASGRSGQRFKGSCTTRCV